MSETTDIYSPFSNDKLGRLSSAEALTNIIKTINQSTVLCIDAPWGQGKTTFLEMWEKSLNEDHFPTVYFNSWENDFSDDALTCLVGELKSAFSADDSKAEEIFNKVKNLAGALSKRAIPVAVKALTIGMINDKEYEKIVAEYMASAAKEQLDKYLKAKDAIGDFRGNLKSLAEELCNDEHSRPLVFIIDELDRCRPDFAIEILEKAKHLFNVENVIFVLGIDKDQLGSSFKAVYGQGLDTDNYLKRFIDYEYKLPPPEKGKFTDVLFGRFSINTLLQERKINSQDVRNHLIELFDLFNLTLRQQERCCMLLSLGVRVSDKNEELTLDLLCFLIVMKVGFSDSYAQWLPNKDSLKALVDTPALVEYNKENSHLWLAIKEYAECIRLYTSDINAPEDQQDGLGMHQMELDREYATFDMYTQYQEEYDYQKNRILVRKKACDRMAERLFNGEDVLTILLSKIDLVSHFQTN